MTLKYLLALVLALSCLVALSCAQDDGLAAQGEQFIVSAEDVTLASVLAKHPDRKIPLGDVVEVLLNFKNVGRNTYNVTAIRGFFLNPQDPSQYVQNFTAWRYDQIAPPGYEISFSYLFLPDELLETREYVFYGDVYYTDETGGQYVSAYYNGTVEMVDTSTPFDTQYVFTYLLFAAIVAGGAYGVSKLVGGKKKRGVKGTGATAVAGDDWVTDSNVSQWKGRKAKKD